MMMLLAVLVGGFSPRSQLLRRSATPLRARFTRADTIDEIAAAAIDASETEMISRVAGPKGAGYGELLPQGMSKLAASTRLGCSDSFLDVGSGTGKLVLQAAAVHGAVKATGVELSPTRHALAVEALERLSQSNPEAASRVRLVLGDAVESEEALAAMRTATVVYANNLLFGEALQERLADFEQREAQKNELNEHMNEEIRKLQAAQAELRREFATLEATAQNAHSEADKSDLQRQLEATEVRLETLVHVDERHDQRYEQAIEGEGQAAETTSDWASDANGAHRSQTGQSEMGNGQEPPGTSATADTSRRVLVGAPAEHLGTELLPETSNTVKDEL